MCALAKCCTFSEVPTLIFTPQPKNSLFQLLHLKLHANKTAHGHKAILETAFIPREARLCLWKNNPNPFSEGLRIFQCVSFSNFKKKCNERHKKIKCYFPLKLWWLCSFKHWTQKSQLSWVLFFFYSFLSFHFFSLFFFLYFFLCMYYVC